MHRLPAALAGAAGLIALLLALPATAGHRETASMAETAATPVVETPATLVGRTQRFELHNDPWLNLHHFLYQWARAEEGLGSGRTAVAVPERGELQQLQPGAVEQWLESLRYYRERIAGLNHFDEGMVRQKVALLKMGGDLSRSPPAVFDGIDDALKNALPVYLEKWWPAHSATNSSWAATTIALLEKHENDFVALTERVYDADWPTEPIRVDLSAYANFRAGYTVYGHTVMYTSDPGNQGHYGFEMLLHEVQHARGVRGSARDRLRERFAEAGARVPRNLWHAMIFATAGAFAEMTAARDRESHESYWQREGFEELEGWIEPAAVVREHWVPVITDGADPDDALERIAGHYLQN